MKGFLQLLLSTFLSQRDRNLQRDWATPRLCLAPKPGIPLQPCKRLVYPTTLESPHQRAVQSPESAGAVRLSSHFQGAGSSRNNFLLVSQHNHDTSNINNLQQVCPQLSFFYYYLFRTQSLYFESWTGWMSLYLNTQLLGRDSNSLLKHNSQ